MKKHFKPFALVALGISIFFFFIFLAEIASMGSHLNEWHPLFAWGFYALVIVFLVFFFVVPLVKIFGKPKLNLQELVNENPDPKHVSRALKILSRKGNLQEEEQNKVALALNEKSDVLVPLREIISKRAEGIEKDIWKYSRSVFITTAISQFGKLDAFFLIVNNFQMLKLIFERYPYRPSYYQMIRIYTRVLVLSFTAMSVEELSDRSIIEEIFPRLHPLGGRTLSSVLQGVTYAFITYRIGLFAKEFFMVPDAYINKAKKDEIRKTAFKKAIKISQSIVTDIPVNIFKKLLKPFK